MEKDEEFGYSKQVLQIAYLEFPYRLEGLEQMAKRGLNLRKFLSSFLKHNKLVGDEKVAIVSHSAFLSNISGEGFDLKND